MVSVPDEVRSALHALGLDPATATAALVISARRRLALVAHPDVGGDPAAMQALNAHCAVALEWCRRPREEPAVPARVARPSDRTPPPPSTRARHRRAGRVERDVPSFTIELLPVEAFEALTVVAAWIGEVVDEDPPYLLEVLLAEPIACWCRLELAPDAGGSTVSLTVAGVDDDDGRSGRTVPSAEAVRDLWVGSLREL